jgi:hypothetical protein
VLLERRVLKEGARVAVGDRSPHSGKYPTRRNTEPEGKKTLKAQPSERQNGDTPLGYSRRQALRMSNVTVLAVSR